MLNKKMILAWDFEVETFVKSKTKTKEEVLRLKRNLRQLCRTYNVKIKFDIDFDKDKNMYFKAKDEYTDLFFQVLYYTEDENDLFPDEDPFEEEQKLEEIKDEKNIDEILEHNGDIEILNNRLITLYEENKVLKELIKQYEK